MQKNYVWIAVGALVPLSLLVGLLVLAPRGVNMLSRERGLI